MAITRLNSFAGEAEVLGKLVEFNFNGATGGIGGTSTLIISGLTMQEAEEVLSRLGTGGMVGVRPPATGTPTVVAAVTPKAPKAETTDLDKVKIQGKAETKAANGETKKAPVETKPPAETKPPVAESKPEPKPDPAPTQPAASDAKPSEAVADGDPDAPFLKASKMRDILYALEDRGIKDEAAMVAECERLKVKVPLLAKMPNIADRVKRTLEVMHGGVAAA